MPSINNYICSRCDLILQRGWGYHFYVEDSEGNRIACRHPGETRNVEKVLGKSVSLEIIRERTGFVSDCVCLDCLAQFEADLGENGWSPYEADIANYEPRVKQGKDKRECIECRSKRVKTVSELVGQRCLSCTDGVIEKIWTGWIS
jgi:hypothetical protein